jgi:hypothetical protein
MRALVLIAVAASATIAVTAASAADRRLSFTRLVHNPKALKGPFAPPVGTTVLVLDSVQNAIDADPFVEETTLTRINETNWRRNFVVGVLVTWPTRGYDVVIRRISLQRLEGGVQQLCVVAAVKTPAPRRVVLQERTTTSDVVRVRRQPANLLVPRSVVVRGEHGRLLYKNTDDHPVRPRACHAS